MLYNILDYGAKTDGVLCTKQIQSAIDDCFLNGGGEVVIPEGTFVTGCIRLRSNITLHLLQNAVLMGSIDPEDYVDYINDKIEPIPMEERDKPVPTINPGSNLSPRGSAYPFSRWNNSLIKAIRANNIAIIGEEGSVIDGQNCFDTIGVEENRGPHAINMWYCENITLRGYTIMRSANWAHAIQNSKNITVDGITVLGGHDGFDARTCDNILIENSTFLTGDDCIAGFDNINVLVRNCHFESACNIFRFGATDMLIENCTGGAPTNPKYFFRGSLSYEDRQNNLDTNENCRSNCLNVFAYYCDDRALIRKTPGNIIVRNCKFKNPDTVVGFMFGKIFCTNRTLSDITFESCVIEGICKSIFLYCPEDEKVTLNLIDCTISARENFEDINFIEGENIGTVLLSSTRLLGFTDPKIICEPTPNIEIK